MTLQTTTKVLLDMGQQQRKRHPPYFNAAMDAANFYVGLTELRRSVRRKNCCVERRCDSFGQSDKGK